MKGNLGEINIGGMLRFLTRYEFKGLLHVKAPGVVGMIRIREGRVTGAKVRASDQNFAGRDAARRIVTLREGGFEFRDGEDDSSLGVSLDMSPESLILEAFRDPAAPPAPNIPPEGSVLAPSPVKAGRDLELSFRAQEWNVLIQFDGNRTLGSAREASGLSKGEYGAIIGGLLTAGLLRRSRFSLPNLHEVAERWMGGVGWSLVDVESRKNGSPRGGMTMRHVLQLLDNIENSSVALIGKAKSKDMVAEMWEAVKR